MLVSLGLESCFDPSKPNYQFFPNMYKSVGYGTYDESEAFNNGIEAQLPVEGTIPRGWMPYEFEDTNEGYDLAKNTLFSPIEKNEENLDKGKELYGVYCAVCHGTKGDGQGILMKREKCESKSKKRTFRIIGNHMLWRCAIPFLFFSFARPCS